MVYLWPRADADSQEQVTGEWEAYQILETARGQVIADELAKQEPYQQHDTWDEHRGLV